MTARYFVVSALLRQAQGGYANLILDAALKKNPLESRERAFATAMFYSVLEHQKTLDYILNQFLKKPVEKLDAPIREILRSGLTQARYMKVPPSAAVNEAVKLVKAFHKTSAAGMVNAVLRKAIAFDLQTATFQNERERLSVLASVSEEIAEFFLAEYPQEALAILSATAENTKTAVRVNPLKTTPQVLTALLFAQGATEVEENIFLPNSLQVAFQGSPADCPAFAEGLFHVEGETSQVAALALAAQPGDTVIDFCAAPGGKTLAIAQEMQDNGTLYSCDVSENRVSLIATALQRLGITCAKAVQNNAATQNPMTADGTTIKAENLADRILADVPCSGLGIFAKKPDIRYKDLSGMQALATLQAAILDNAAACLKVGGRLVYSTCTVHPAENQQQVQAFLRRHPNFTVAAIPYLPQGMACGEYGALSLPNRTGLDGFFICAMEKH